MTGNVPRDLPSTRKTISLSLRNSSDLPLQSGDTVGVRLLKQISGARWQISLNGKVLSATVHLPAYPGMVLSARVTKMPGGKLILEVTPPAAEERIAAQLGLQPSPEIRSIVSALMSSVMPIQPARVEQILSLFLKLRTRNASAARILAMLEDRGINLTADQVEQLIQGIDANGVTGSGDGSGSFDEPDKGGQRTDTPIRETPAPEPKLVEPEALSARLAELLHYFAERTASQDSHLLQLYNHVTAEHDHWIAIPFGYSLDEMHVHGSLRVRVRSVSSRSPQVALQVELSDDKWLFSWPLSASSQPQPMRIYHTGKSRVDARALEEQLAKLGFKLAGRIRSVSETDGFPEQTDPLSAIGFDAVV